MLNKKGQMQLPTGHMDYHHQLPLVKPEPGMERSVSPHGSEHSQYSNPHNMARGYPSPTMMQAPMHISNPLPAAMQMTGYPDMPNMGHMPNMAMQQMTQQPPVPQQPAKQYPCSTCGKAFARRSDLARHGEFCLCFQTMASLTLKQNVSIAVSDHISATGPAAESSSFRGPP
jgi:hypothetical protein